MTQLDLKSTLTIEPCNGRGSHGDTVMNLAQSNPTDSMRLPAGSEILELQFVTDQMVSSTNSSIWMELGDGARTKAMLIHRMAPTQLPTMTAPTGNLVLIAIPHLSTDNSQLVQRLQHELESESTHGGEPVNAVLLTLQGTQILWRPNRIVVFAPPERMDSVSRAIVAASFFEAELRSLEHSIDGAWDQLQTDSVLAFEFDERAVPRRAELLKRFQTVLSWRTRFVRLAPQVLVPHVHPPTLASQIGERLRERTRMAERLELMNGKLEAQERIYELCSQRASDFMVARTGHHLEWAIIVLLLIQTIIYLIEFLGSASS